MTKGYRVIKCPECDKKRHCTRISISNHNFRWTCSKGHSWIIKGITLERIASVMEEIFTPEKMKNLFERDDMFYRSLKR